ncbi:MAG: hypothetical protein V4719_02860 [Planctomycetota bacterium]
MANTPSGLIWDDRFILYEKSDVRWLRELGQLKASDKVFLRVNRIPLFHGTCVRALETALAGGNEIQKVWKAQFNSLDGAYFTTDFEIANFYARESCENTNLPGAPVILLIDPIFDLYPDEDWVCCFHTNHAPIDRYGEFYDHLVSDFRGPIRHPIDLKNGEYSLNQHYRDRYHMLNPIHGINWLDGLEFSGNLRQQEWLHDNQILGVIDPTTRNFVDRYPVRTNVFSW